MLIPFDPEQHLGDVQRWSILQNVEPPSPEMLPRVGFIEPGVAAGWLYQTDSGVGFLETFVTNPEAPLVARHTAIDDIGIALIKAARGIGLLRLVSMTTHRSIGRMMIRRGFAYSGPMHVLRLEV